MKAVLFTNWTNEDFNYTWDSVVYEFPAGQSVMLFDYLAEHFAKHLAVRECDKKKLPTDGVKQQEFAAKCLGKVTEAPNANALLQEVAKGSISADATIGSPAKTSKSKAKEAEEEFEGLKS